MIVKKCLAIAKNTSIKTTGRKTPHKFLLHRLSTRVNETSLKKFDIYASAVTYCKKTYITQICLNKIPYTSCNSRVCKRTGK